MKIMQDPAIVSFLNLAKDAIIRENNKGVLLAFLKTNRTALTEAAAKAAKVCEHGLAYLSALTSSMAGLLESQEKFTRGQQTRVSSLSRELVAAVANQGRTPELFAASVQEIVERCGTATAVATEFRAYMDVAPRNFQVAVVVDATVRTLGIDTQIFRRIDPKESVGWSAPTSASKRPTADMDLTRFCLRHWGMDGSADTTAKHGLQSQILIMKARAWDGEQARHAALDAAEGIVDRINAEHRTSQFGVKRKVMVWEEGDKGAFEVLSRNKLVPTTRMLNISQSPSVNRSLRFASRAAGERAGSMQVFFAWIALEYLGRGTQKTPQNLVAENVPFVISLVALRQLCVHAWWLLTRESGAGSLPTSVLDVIKRGTRSKSRHGLGTKKRNPNEFDMNKLMALLISDGLHLEQLATATGVSVEIAEAAVREWVSFQQNLSPYSAYQVNHIRGTLRDDTRLKQFMEEVRIDADETMQRMRFVRNQTAHNAGVGSTEHLPLSEAALKVLDAVFETVPQWGGSPAVSLGSISKRWKEVALGVQKRGNARHELPFDAVKVLKP
ncbi:hypothetical protein [Arthrobacter sp. zg-Y769]|uniref:hypothetical protein n=1 Tax=Arthrobacter sp. zg-Y769 TaxID=2894191 RepID=UPI001E52C7D8|nr:hypothetical protein [Arthrobacter sp. zg-Y769]MCC9205866.1 hypothetical protein [Arthrobacter sp. zg-Y769]